jgi:hypothetical protein
LGIYVDTQECKEAALRFSRENNIVKSDEWANLKEETLSGGWDHISNEIRTQNGVKNKGVPKSEDHKRKISENHKDVSGDKNPMFGKAHSEETRAKMRKPKTDDHKQKIKDWAIKRVEEGTHPWLGADRSRKMMIKRVEEGTHPWQNTLSVFNIVSKKIVRISREEFTMNRSMYVGLRSPLAKEVYRATP